MIKPYFCVFCAQVSYYWTCTELRDHLLDTHFNREKSLTETKTENESQSGCSSHEHMNYTNRWIDIYIDYNTDLIVNLSKPVKSLPKTHAFDALLNGCVVCDTIIPLFKLSIIKRSKRNQCFCGNGFESTNSSVKVSCLRCKRSFHWDCVEINPYEAQELSLYLCVNCVTKEFDITNITQKSRQYAKTHCLHHLNYEPYVCRCKLVVTNGDLKTIRSCNERFITKSFLESHLKHCHSVLTIAEKCYDYEPISQIDNLLDNYNKTLFTSSVVSSDFKVPKKRGRPAKSCTASSVSANDVKQHVDNNLCQTCHLEEPPLYNETADIDWLQCSKCFAWHHSECVGSPRLTDNDLWICAKHLDSSES